MPPDDFRPAALNRPEANLQGSIPRQSEAQRRRSAVADGPLPTYAALDLGTNNCRLLVAEPAGAGFRVVDSYSRIVRLGEGVAADGRLSEAAMGRTIEALQVCAGRVRKHGVTRFRGVATDACRRAANADDFAARVREETGLELEIIAPEAEAHLALDGCVPLVARSGGHLLLFDIGGGSTEMLWVRAPANGEPEMIDWTSLPLGVVGLAERYGQDRVSAETFAAMVAEIAKAVAPFATANGITAAAGAGPVQLLGTSGTGTTVAGLHLGLGRYDRSRVDGLEMAAGDVFDVFDRLLGMDFQERAASPCVGAGRGDVVIAGCAILKAIMDACPAAALHAADRGLREGILFGMMRADRAIA